MKKLIVVFISITLLFIFAACVDVNTPTDNTSKQTAEITDDSTALCTEEHSLAYNALFDPETDFNNEFGQINLTLINTEDAYYYGGDSGLYLYYYDKATGETSVLCAKPECMHDAVHDNKECNGYLNSYRGETICLVGDKIYYDYTEELNRILFRMNTDGTGREKLFEFEKSFQYRPQWTAVHRGKLYGINHVGIIEDAEPIQTWNVTCWDINTGAWKVLYEENTTAWPTLFFLGKNVYFCASHTESEMTEDGAEIIGDTNIKVFCYDTETEVLEKLVDVTGPDYSMGIYVLFAVDEHSIYAAPANAGGQTSVYLVSDGELKEAFKVNAFGRITLHSDFLLLSGFEQPKAARIEDRRFRVSAVDYDGNTLFDETLDLDIVRNTADSITALSYEDIFYIDGAIFVAYHLTCKSNDESGGKFRTVLIKYDFVDGMIEQTLIAVEKWAY